MSLPLVEMLFSPVKDPSGTMLASSCTCLLDEKIWGGKQKKHLVFFFSLQKTENLSKQHEKKSVGNK